MLINIVTGFDTSASTTTQDYHLQLHVWVHSFGIIWKRISDLCIKGTGQPILSKDLLVPLTHSTQ